MMFKRKPLDAITQEVIISLRDEPERWQGASGRMLREITVLRAVRDDGLLVSVSTGGSPDWLVPSIVSVRALGATHQVKACADRRAIVKAMGAWFVGAPARETRQVSAFLSRVR